MIIGAILKCCFPQKIRLYKVDLMHTGDVLKNSILIKNTMTESQLTPANRVLNIYALLEFTINKCYWQHKLCVVLHIQTISIQNELFVKYTIKKSKLTMYHTRNCRHTRLLHFYDFR